MFIPFCHLKRNQERRTAGSGPWQWCHLPRNPTRTQWKSKPILALKRYELKKVFKLRYFLVPIEKRLVRWKTTEISYLSHTSLCLQYLLTYSTNTIDNTITVGNEAKNKIIFLMLYPTVRPVSNKQNKNHNTKPYTIILHKTEFPISIVEYGKN